MEEEDVASPRVSTSPPRATEIVKKLDFEEAQAESEGSGGAHMKVYLRVRPFSDSEIAAGEKQDCIEIVDETYIMANPPKDSNTFKNAGSRTSKGPSQKFSFTKIFNEDTSQRMFFDEAVLGTLKDFIQGQNCLLFTYGVTNSGKTFTIQGYKDNVGILPRALAVIFNSIDNKLWSGQVLKPVRFCDVMSLSTSQEDEDRKVKATLLKLADSDDHESNDMTVDMSRLTTDTTMSEDSLMLRQSIASGVSVNLGRVSGEMEGEALTSISESLTEYTRVDMDGAQGQFKYSVWVSFAEIYNENIHDLLEPIQNKKKTTKNRPILSLREDQNGTPYVRGLKEINVKTADEAFKLLTLGRKNLQIACTKLNRQSSRSHCIFTIKLIQVVDTTTPSAARTSMLSFCDLAGSERYTKTQTDGTRIKEAGNINTSLLTLGRCIQVLKRNQTSKDQPQMVPFRESKLTRMFQSFFCGKGRAAMIVNINQCASTFDETLHALKYSAIAKQIIVVQEKPKMRSEKFSILLSQNSRETIGWATPGTCAKALQEEEEELEEDDEETASETEREKELMEMLQQMKQMLVAEKKKQLMLEAKIREEVCEEMAQQLVKIEDHYSERLRREQVHQEEKAERRMEILTQSVLKSRKRQRIFEDHDNEESPVVPSLLLQEEQAKVQTLEKLSEEAQDKLSTVTAERDSLRDAAASLTQERDKLQQENTTVKFKLNDLEKQLQKQMFHKDESMSQSQLSEMADLVGKLADTESELENQTEAVTKLQQFIDILQCNAGEAEDRIAKANQDADEAKKGLVEKENALEEMQSQVQVQEEQLQQMQSSLEQLSEKLERQQKDNEEQDELMEGLRQELSERAAEYERLLGERRESGQQELSTVRSEVDRLEEEVKAAVEDRDTAKEKVEHVERDRDSLRRQLDEAQKLVTQREEELEVVKTTAEQSGQEELKAKEDSLRQLLAGYIQGNAEMDSLQELAEAIQRRCEELTAAVEAKEELLFKAEEAQQELQEEMEGVRNRLGDLQEMLQQNESSHQVQIEEFQAKITGLEAASSSADEKSEAIGNLRAEVSTLNAAVSAKTQQIELLTSERSSKASELEKLQKELADLGGCKKKFNSLKKKFEDSQGQLDDYIVKVNLQVEEISKLKEAIAEMKAEQSGTAEELKAAKDEGSRSQKLVEKLEAELKEKYDLLDSEEDKFEQKLADVEEKLREAKEQLEAARESQTAFQSQKVVLERRLSGLQASMDREHNEHETERKEHEEEISRARAEIQAKKTELAEAESELEHLRGLASGQEKDKSDVQAEMDELKRTIRELDQKVNDTEYNHQISVRQLRREKGAVEKLLKAAEEEKSELEEKLKEQDERITKHESRANKLEEVVKDLEICLKSSKEHEARAQEEFDAMKTRCRRLETDCNSKEDTICSLTEEFDRFREESMMAANQSMLDNAAQLGDKMQELQNNYDELQRKFNENKTQHSSEAKDLQSQLIGKANELAEMTNMLERREKTVEELKKEVLGLESKLDEHKSKLREGLDSTSKQMEEAVRDLTESRSELNEKVAVITELEAKCQSLESALDKRQEDLAELERHLQGKSEEVADKDTNLLKAEHKCTELEKEVSRLEECKQDLEKDVTAKTRHLSGMTDLEKRLQEVEETNAEKVADLKSQLESQMAANADLTDKIAELNARLQEHASNAQDHAELQQTLKAKCTAVEKTSAENEKNLAKITALETDLEVLRKQKGTSDRLVTTLQGEVDELEGKLSKGKHSEKESSEREKRSRAEMAEKLSAVEVARDGLREEILELKRLATEQAAKHEDKYKNLKIAMEEQEAAMNIQDNVLQDRENKIEALTEDLAVQQERLTKLLEKDGTAQKTNRSLREELEKMERKLQAVEEEARRHKSQTSDHNEEITGLQRAKNRTDDRLAAARQKIDDLEKRLRDATAHDADLQETTRELQAAERALKEKDEELSSVRRQVQSLQSAAAAESSQHSEAESSARALHLLRTKFQVREELVKQLEQEKLQWKTRAESIEEQKAEELKKWRNERDTLVSKIEQILKEKDSEIKALKESEMTSESQTPSRRRQRSSRSRKTSVEVGSASSEEDLDGLKRDLELAHQQISSMRQEHKQEVNKIIKAKDSIIEDMRNQNHKLTDQIAAEEISGHVTAPITTVLVADSSEDDFETTKRSTAKPRGSKSRKPRKRKSSENEPSDESAPVATTTGKRSRKSTRTSQRTSKSHQGENQDPALEIISEEGMIDLDDTAVHQKSSVLSNTTNTQEISADSSRIPTFLSPKSSAASTAATPKRKRRLKSTAPEPMMESPVDLEAGQVVESAPAHDVVKRKLRSRKK